MKGKKVMTKRLYIIALLSIVTIMVNAQPSVREVNGDVKNYPVIRSVSGYNGTVYQPFSETVPSEQTEVGAQYAQKPTTGPRRGFDTPDDPNQSEEYPLGDGLWPLLLMALAAGAVVYLRQRKEKSLKQ